MLELAQGFRLDLTNTFACHAELLADLFQRVVGVHADAKAHPQNTFFARGEDARTRVVVSFRFS